MIPYAAPFAAAGERFREDFNTGSPGWTLDAGVTRDCTRGATGCSIRLQPPCCSTYVFATRPLSSPMSGVTTVSFWFTGSSTGGDTDSAFIVDLSNGGGVAVHTSAPPSNNRLLLESNGGSSSFATWPTANAWNRVELRLDPSANTVRASMWDSSGNGPFTSSTLTIPAASDSITGIRFYGVFWGGGASVWWYDDVVVSDASNIASAPTNFAASRGPASHEITLDWSAPASDGGLPITGYRITRTPSGGATTMFDVGDVRNHRDTGLAAGTTYAYTIAAINSAGVGTTASASATTFPTPSAPRDVQAVSTSPGTIQVTWTPPAELGGPETLLYRVYRSTTLGVRGDWIWTEPTTGYTDTKMPTGTYFYTIVAAKAGAVGPGSAQAAGPTASLFASAPRNLVAATTQVFGEIELRWDAPSAGAEHVTGYEVIDIHPDQDVTSVAVGNVLSTKLAFREEGSHGYFVRALGGQGPGRESNSASVVSEGPVILGFGDSVAAGYGLGYSDGYPNNRHSFPDKLAAQLGGVSYNFAVEGACSATAGEIFSHRDTFAGCDYSVLHEQIPAARNWGGVPKNRASAIVLNVGANDIGFAGCLADFFAGKYAFLIDDPCSRGDLAASLGAYRENMHWVVEALRGEFGANVPIVLNRYYHIFPDADDASIAGRTCGLFASHATKGLHAYDGFENDDTWNGRLATAQREANELADRIIGELNRAVDDIAAANGLLVATPDFSGHDMCRAERDAEDGIVGVSPDTWVWGPTVNAVGQRSSTGEVTDRFFGPAPETCPAPDLAKEEEHNVLFFLLGGKVAIHVVINCLAHPTVPGQEEIARAIATTLVHDTFIRDV